MYMYESHHIFVPPDGGWYWTVVLAAFYANFVVDGILLSFGIFLEEFRQYFEVTTGILLMVPTINCGLNYLVVPFVTAMVNKYGFRCATFLGGLLAAFCFLATSLAIQFTWLIIINGIFAGVTLCMVYAPTKIAIGFYFGRKRSLASVLVESGSGFGIMFFSQVLSNIELNFGWSTTYCVMAGFLFLSPIFSLTYRPLRATRIIVEEEAVPRSSRTDLTNIKCSRFCWDPDINNKNIPTTKQVVDRNKIMLDDQRSSQMSFEIGKYDTITTNTTTTAGTDSTRKIRKDINFDKKCCGLSYKTRRYLVRSVERLVTCYQCRTNNVNRPIYRDDIFYNQDLILLAEYRQHQDINISLPDTSNDAYRRVDYHMSITRIARPKTEDEDTQYIHQCCWSLPTARTIITMLDLRILKSPSIFVFSLSCFFVGTSFLAPFLFIVEQATLNNMPRAEALWLLSIIGLTYIVGKIICFAISSYTKISSTSYCFVNLMIAGISTLISGMDGLVDRRLQFPYAIIYGFTISCITTLRPKIIVDLFGLQNLTNVYGIQTLWIGVGIVLGLTCYGIILDKTGSYMIVFIFSGCGLVISGLLLVISQYINERSLKTKQ